jgi:competence protein ComEC
LTSKYPTIDSRRALRRLNHKIGHLWSLFGVLIFAERQRWSLWVPVGLGVGIVAYFSLGMEPSLGIAWGLAAIGTVLCMLAVIGHRVPVAAILLASFVGFGLIGFSLAKFRTELVRAPTIERELEGVRIEGKLLAIKSGSDGKARLVVAPTRIQYLARDKLPAKVQLSYRSSTKEFSPGQMLRMRASLMPPPEPVAPNGFDFARQSWYTQVGGLGFTYGKAYVMEEDRVRTAPKLLPNVAAFRAGLANHISQQVGGEAGAMAKALITGDRSGIPPENTEALRAASLAHLLAISGLHMGLAGWALYSIVRLLLSLWPTVALRYPIKKIAAGVGLVGAAFYLVVSGAPFSAQRAFIMLGLVLLAIILDRPAFTLRMVAIAATIILILQPESILQAGFQMSFAACTGLVAAHEARRKWQAGRIKVGAKFFNQSPGIVRGNLERMPNKVFTYLRGLMFTSFLAGLSTAPFAAYHFNQFANYGLIANLLAVPIMAFVIMPMAVMGLLTMPFGLDAPFFQAMGFGINWVMVIAFEVASWPQAISHVSAWPSYTFGMIVLGGLWMCLWQTSWRMGGAVVAVLGIFLGRAASPPDLVIDRDATNIAVLAEDGDLIVMSKRKKYAANTWSRRSGQGNTYEAPEEEFKCDIMGCVYEEEGRPIVAYIADGRAFEDDCVYADIIISNEPVPFGCQAPSLIVDQFDVYENGSYAIWFEEDGYRVVTSAEARGKRPWVRVLPGKVDTGLPSGSTTKQ